MKEKPLSPDLPLVEAVRAIEASRRRIAVVIDEEGRLMGTLTDGDVRRCLLGGGGLDTIVAKAMNPAPVTAAWDSSDGCKLDLMRRANVMALPVVDVSGKFIKLVHLTDIAPGDELVHGAAGFSFAVIMAGGEGMRLRPLTEKTPKPMVEIGGVPLIQRQIERLLRVGIGRIYIAVNYLSHVIEEHFGDGSDFGLEIHYLREHEKLGTAGALSLLPERPVAPILVMNGDILTTFDFGSLYDFHISHKAEVTVAAVDYRVNIPYGVIRADGPYVAELTEKPSQRFLCNAGIYAISPAALDFLPQGSRWNMTDMVESCIAANRSVAVFPIHEYWSDIGTPEDLNKARALFR